MEAALPQKLAPPLPLEYSFVLFSRSAPLLSQFLVLLLASGVTVSALVFGEAAISAFQSSFPGEMPVLEPPWVSAVSHGFYFVFIVGSVFPFFLFLGWTLLAPSGTEHNGSLPFVSVLIPAFNEERSIARSIEAALELDYPNFEVIAVDDGSTDFRRRTSAISRGPPDPLFWRPLHAQMSRMGL